MDPLPRFRLILVLTSCVISASAAQWGGSDAQGAEPDRSAALQLFEERIMPIFRSDKPSSCVQCHLASVDIKDYIRPSHTETFLALKNQGLINPADPSQSKILTLIQMGDQDLDRGARLIHEVTRRAEYEAFAAWIDACCDDDALIAMPAPTDSLSIGPAKPLEVIRHARKSRLLDSFTRNVWSQRMRCFPCHTPYELDKENPNHGVPSERHREFVKEHGAKMNLFQKTPEETFSRLIAGSRTPKPDRYPMINLADPTKSLLVLKPTSKIPAKLPDGTLDKPSSFDPVSHLGGLKMHVNDHSYKAIVSWIEDYAAVVGDQYLTAEDLPADNWTQTDRVMRISEAPESWGVLSTIQLFVHAPDDATQGWSTEPIAFTQALITPRRLAAGPLILIRSSLNSSDAVDTDSNQREATENAFPLAPGKYLIRAYVDSAKRLDESPSSMLDESDFVGQTVIDAKWQIGFPKAETFSAQALDKAGE